MAKEKYKEWHPQRETQTILEHLAEIIEDYKSRGFYPLSLRQIYYQAVAHGYIPNTKASYDAMGNYVKRARESGLWDWDAIEDRNRTLLENVHFESPQERIYHAAKSYHIDKRKTQPVYIECWIEKAALIGVLEKVASQYDVPCFACRGFVSSTANHEAAERFKAQMHRERRIILYAGDYDPCGFSIHESISDRLKMFGADVELIRIALTKEQIDIFNPPPAPVKKGDSRAKGFIEEHGADVWELDALDPSIIANLFSEHIEKYTDFDLFNDEYQREHKERRMIDAIYSQWDELFSEW